MMRDNPQGAELLKEARHVLTGTVLPLLSSEEKYQLLMAIRAIKLAERQFLADSETEARLTGLLAGYIETGAIETDPVWALSRQIRNGDRDASAEVFGFLQQVTAFKLKETMTDNA